MRGGPREDIGLSWGGELGVVGRGPGARGMGRQGAMVSGVSSMGGRGAAAGGGKRMGGEGGGGQWSFR